MGRRPLSSKDRGSVVHSSSPLAAHPDIPSGLIMPCQIVDTPCLLIITITYFNMADSHYNELTLVISDCTHWAFDAQFIGCVTTAMALILVTLSPEPRGKEREGHKWTEICSCAICSLHMASLPCNALAGKLNKKVAHMMCSFSILGFFSQVQVLFRVSMKTKLVNIPDAK